MEFNYYIMKTPHKTGIMNLIPIAGFHERVDAYNYYNSLLTRSAGVAYSVSILTHSQLAEMLVHD